VEPAAGRVARFFQAPYAAELHLSDDANVRL
jgi:hypothetical protein